MGNAGRVLMIPKGDYNAATTYEMLDFVYYQGRSYVCKQTSTGNVPTNTTYWQALTGDASAEIQALTNYVADTGVKNFLKNEITTTSTDGMTFTKNADGTITTGGSNTSQSTKNIFLTPTVGTTFKKGTYILNGCPSGANGFGLFLISTQGSISGIYDRGNGIEFTLATDVTDLIVTINVDAGKSIDGLTFKPMIRLATDADPTYQPYAKTNVELTQDASWLTSAKTYYDANTDPTVKQNHYNVAKYFYDFIKPGESHTVIIRYAGGYYDTMILSRDNGTGLFCVDFCHADGLGKILYFRYNGTSDTFTDLFSVT